MADFKCNDIVTGCVTGIEKYGIFVSLNNYYSGLVHISEISKNYVKNVDDYVDLGETIKVRILGVDEDNHHLKLSIKDLDYRMNRKNKSKIIETPNGFSTLKSSLSNWIESKKSELLTQRAIK